MPTPTTANATHPVYDPAGRVVRSELRTGVVLVLDTSGAVPLLTLGDPGTLLSATASTFPSGEKATAAFVSPAMACLFLRPKHQGESKFFLFRWFNAGLKWIEDSYDSFLEFTAHHWWTIVVPSA
jgi:hypothetical protein